MSILHIAFLLAYGLGAYGLGAFVASGIHRETINKLHYRLAATRASMDEWRTRAQRAETERNKLDNPGLADLEAVVRERTRREARHHEGRVTLRVVR